MKVGQVRIEDTQIIEEVHAGMPAAQSRATATAQVHVCMSPHPSSNETVPTSSLHTGGGKLDAEAAIAHLRVFVDEHERVGHVHVAQVHHGRADPAADARLAPLQDGVHRLADPRRRLQAEQIDGMM